MHELQGENRIMASHSSNTINSNEVTADDLQGPFHSLTVSESEVSFGDLFLCLCFSRVFL